MHYTLKPLSQRAAKAFIDEHHRHHKSSRGDVFRIGLMHEEELIGVIQVGRPVARLLDDGYTLEVTRLCVLDGYKNACSMLYSRAWRAGKALGYTRIVTYILEIEAGVSLAAAGWVKEPRRKNANTDWNCQSRPREQQSLYQELQKIRYGRAL